MNRDIFKNLPSEIITEIPSRLPVRSVISCKCVCKPWLSLVKTHEFVNAHLSKSVPGLAIHESGVETDSYRFYEFEDELDLEHHELHYSPVTDFNLPFSAWINNSANGLLLLREIEFDALYIYNPIIREYIRFDCPQVSNLQEATYGLGASKITYKYKVVGIFQECTHDEETRKLLIIPKYECHVYTLGTGSWRRIAPGAPLGYDRHTCGEFLNGNLHWLVFDLNGCPWISCFDLETEHFSTFSSPPFPGSSGFLVGLFTLGNCLCLCDNTSDDEIVIWLMKEYGVERSWTKEFVISKIPKITNFSYDIEVVRPIKVFKDGDILMAWSDLFLFFYSNKNKTTQRIQIFDSGLLIGAVPHTPSFLSLKSFGMENVSPF